MRRLFVPALALGLALSGSALAQSSGSPSAQPGSQATASPNQGSLLTAQKLQQDLQNAGFTDVNVVAEAFVVRAKTKDGNPVVMTIGPNGMSAFETITPKSATTGATGSGSGAAGSSTSK
jgi:hypothetical protein